MAEYLNVDGGTIAYEVAGEGPLIVLAHGLGDSRDAYRVVARALVAEGYRVAVTDLRGCGESSARWPSFTSTDIARDLVALIRHLGGPAVLVGHSKSGGAATVAAAEAPDVISGIVELAPFTRKLSIKLGDLRIARYRRGALRLLGAGLFGSKRLWHGYLEHACPGRKPAGWTGRLARIDAMLDEPGRMTAFQRMVRSAPTDADARLADVHVPALIVEGSLDPDWADPRAEGEAVVAAMPAGVGRLHVIEGVGHYPHVECPDEVTALILTFLRAHARA